MAYSLSGNKLPYISSYPMDWIDNDVKPSQVQHDFLQPVTKLHPTEVQ